jgi:ketosteroid isomerase-like protein
MQMRVERFSHLFFVPPIVCTLFLGAAHCLAQQARAIPAATQTDVQRFQRVEDRWSEAINKRDQQALQSVLSPELIDISAVGDITTRNLQIAMLLHESSEPLSLDQRVANVRTFGDLAVVIGTYVEQLQVNDQPVQRKGIFTHIYQRVQGDWLCVNAHRTTVVEPARQKARGSKKQEAAEPPFLLPQVHQGESSTIGRRPAPHD